MENGHDLPANSAEYVPLKRAAETLASQRFAGAAVSGRPRKWSIGTGGVVQEMCSRPGENVEDAGVLKNGEKGREVSRVEKVWEKLERTLKQIDRKKTSDTAPVSSDILSGIGALEGDSAKRCTVSEEVKALADKLNVRRPRRQSWDEQGSNAENKDSRDRHSMESMHATGKQWQLIASDSLAISATDALHRDRVAESPFRAASDELARTSALIHEAPRLESGIASESSNRPTPGNLEPIRHQAFDEVSEERQSGSDSGGRERLVLQRVDGRLRWTPEGGSPQNEGIAEPRSRQREPEQNGGPSLNQATITEREPRSAPSEIGSQSTAPSSEHATGASNTAGRSNGGATSVSYELLRLTSVAESIRRRAAGGIQITSSSSRRPESGTSALRVARSMQEAQGLVLGAIRKQRELDSQSTPNSVKASADSSVSPRKSSQREGLDLVERAWSGEQVDSEVVIRIQMTSPRGRQEFVSVGEGGNRDEARSGRKYLHEGEVERNGHSERRRQAGESVKKQITDAGRVVRGPFGSGVSGGQESREEDGCTLRSGARQDAEEGTNGSAQTESKNLEVKMEELGTVINAEEEGGPRSEAKSGRNFDTTCAAEVRRSLANGEESSEEVAVAVGSGQKTGGLEQVQQREGGGKPCSGLRERSTSMGLFTGAESLGAFGAARLESEGIQPANTGATDIERPSEIEKGESQEERWGGRSTGVTLDGNRRGDTQANLALETAAPCDDESEAGIGSVKDFFTPRRVGEKDAQVTSYQGRHGECESPGGVAKCELPSSTAAERASAPAWRGNGHVFTPHRGEAEENAYAAVGSRVTSPSEAVTSPALGSRLSQPTAFGWRASAGAKKASVNPENENSETVNPESVARPAERRLSLEVLPLDGERAGFAARAKAWRERLGTRANVSNVRGAERGCVGGESLDKGEKGRVASGDGTEEVKAGSIRGWCNQEGPPGAWRAANAEEEATETGTEEESEGQRLGRPGHVSDWLEAGSEKIRAWDGNLPGESTRRRREKGSAAQLGESEKGATMARERNRGADNRERTRIDLPGGSDRRGRSRNASRHRYPRSNSGSPSSGRRRNGRNSADSRIGRGKTKRGGKQSRSVSGESTGRSKPGPGERPESFSPRRSRFFKAVHEPGRVSREDWKAGTESSSGSSNGDNFERGRSDSGDHGSDSPEAERNGETQRNGGTGYRSGRKAREERRGRSVTRSEHRSRPRSKLSTSPRSRSYDRPSAQRTRKEALRGRPKTDRGAPEAEGQNGNGTLRDEETVCVVATEGSEAVSWADALFGAGENEEGICAPSKGLPLRLEDPAPSAMAVRSKENDLGVAAPLEPEERPVEGEGSAANDVGTEKAVSGPLLEPNLGAIECEQNGNESRNRLTDSVTAIKAKDSIAPERNLNGTEKAPAQPERGEGFGVANSGHVDAAVFLSAAGRLRAVAQQVRAWVEVGEQAKLQGITDTILGICEETALAALKAAGSNDVQREGSGLPFLQ